MTPEEQRIAIAKACGWMFREGNKLCKWRSPTWHWKRSPRNYVSDLNAMHEAEKVLTDEQWIEYSIRLCGAQNSELVNRKYLRISAHATAAQRAEAFLRTLNLWTEGKDVDIGNLPNGGN